MHEHENVDVVKDAYRAVNENNFDVLRECLDENVKWFAIGPPHLIPTAGTRYGIEQVEQYFRLLQTSGELQKLTPLEFIAEENKVVAIGEQELNLVGNARASRSPWVHVFTFRRGRICEFRAFYDTASAVSALNAVIRTGKKLAPRLEPGIPAIF
jgi:ketosteroid isomerase-like protein